MLNKLKRIFLTASNKNILTLFSGNFIAQILPLLFAPWIARLYTPTEVGIFAIIFSFTNVLSTIVNGRYEMAIVIPKSNSGTFSLVFLSVIIALIFFLLLLPIPIFFSNEIAILLKNPSVKNYLIYVPIITLLIGIYNPLRYYFTRIGNFKILTYSQVSKSASQSILQIALGLTRFKDLGLVLGYTFSQFFGNTTIIKSFIKNLKISVFRKVDLKSLKYVAYKFKEFPQYSVWGIFLTNIAQNVTIFYIGSLFGNENLGYFSFMQRYINAPLFLISNTIGQVYVQEIAKNLRLGKTGMPVYKSYIKKLGILSLGILIPMFFSIDYFVRIFFGHTWTESATITKIMIPLFFVRFISVPLTLTISVYQKQKLALFLQLGIFVMTLLPIFYAQYAKLTMESFLYLQTWVLSVYYFLLIYVFYKVVMRGDRATLKHNKMDYSLSGTK